MSGAQIKDPTHARAFALAGNARLTLVSAKTGTRFTFRIRKPEEQRGDVAYFVSLLNGPDNESSFAYLGTLRSSQAGIRFERGKRSKIGPDAPSGLAFSWFWKLLMQGQLHPRLELWHEGRCGRCGRPLTVPSSIASGLGPECQERVGFRAEAV